MNKAGRLDCPVAGAALLSLLTILTDNSDNTIYHYGLAWLMLNAECWYTLIHECKCSSCRPPSRQNTKTSGPVQDPMTVDSNYLTKLNQVVHCAQNSCPSSGPSASPAQMGHGGGLANKTSQWWFMMMILIMMCYSVWHCGVTVALDLHSCDSCDMWCVHSSNQLFCSSAALDSALSGSEVTEARPGPARAFNSVSLQWVSPGNKFGDSDTLRLSKSPSPRPRHGKFNQVGDRGLAPCHVVDGDGEGHSPLGSTHGVHGQAQASNWSLEIIDYIVCLLILELTLQSFQGAEALAKLHQRSISCKN